MNCMKCGREINADRVFCEDCLADMEKYPVKPGIVVHIPTRPAASLQKKTTRKVLSPEEQVKVLNSRVRRLWAALILSGLLTAAAAGLAVYGLHDEELKFLPGQNYSSDNSSKSTESN